MKRVMGGETVKGGYYFNVRDWRLEVLEGTQGTLPGDARYLRVPMLMLLALAPLMGLAFVVLLPFIGLAVIGEQVLRRAHLALGKRPLAALFGVAKSR